jgi:hypothetical protein
MKTETMTGKRRTKLMQCTAVGDFVSVRDATDAPSLAHKFPTIQMNLARPLHDNEHKMRQLEDREVTEQEFRLKEAELQPSAIFKRERFHESNGETIDIWRRVL